MNERPGQRARDLPRRELVIDGHAGMTKSGMPKAHRETPSSRQVTRDGMAQRLSPNSQHLNVHNRDE